MKKLHNLALAAITLALFACNSKPAESDQQSEEQVETTLEQAEEFVEQALEAGEPAVSPDETGETLVEEGMSSETEEAPVSEEQSAEEPAPEQPAEQAAPEEPAVPSDKYEIAGSDGNYVAFRNKVVTADADGCVDVAFVFDDALDSNLIALVITKRGDPKVGHVAVPESGLDTAREILGIGHKANEKSHRDRSDGDDG